jgi:hypothetical protein
MMMMMMMMMMIADSPKTLEMVYQITWHRIPEETYIH